MLKKITNLLAIALLLLPLAVPAYLVWPKAAPEPPERKIVRRLRSANRVTIIPPTGGRMWHEIDLRGRMEVDDLLLGLEPESAGQVWTDKGTDAIRLTFYFDDREPIETDLLPLGLTERVKWGEGAWYITLKDDRLFAKVCEHIAPHSKLMEPNAYNRRFWPRLFAGKLKRARSVQIIRKTNVGTKELKTRDPLEITYLAEGVQADKSSSGYYPARPRVSDLVIRFDTEELGLMHFFLQDAQVWVVKWAGEPNHDLRISFVRENPLYKRALETLEKAEKEKTEKRR